MKKKKYALFGGDSYYASGGADDFVGWFDTLYDATDFAEKNKFTLSDNEMVTEKYLDVWAHIADSKTMKVILWCRIRGKEKPIWRQP